MNNSSIEPYLKQFGSSYLGGGIFQDYPETKIIPRYIKQHFSQAEVVLDLGFGTGLWFWASFFPRLKRIDGFDLYPEAVTEADRVFAFNGIPEGFCVAHRHIGEEFSLSDLQALEKKRGYLVIQDYRQPWPEQIIKTRYDLVTEHGGGLGALGSEREFVEVTKLCAQVLSPCGSMLFVNFAFKKPSPFEEHLREDRSRAVHLRGDLFLQSVEHAGMRMIDFHAIHEPRDMPDVQTFFYGFAQKLK